MASPSKADEAPAPLRGTAALAAGLRAGRTHRSLPGIGDLGRSARWFSSLTFLSASARRALYLTYQGMRVDRELVRPPDYWTGFQPEELESAPRVRTGDAAYDRLLAQRAAQARARMARAHVPRGLPSTVHRRSYSVAGPLTAPGGVARRLQPMVVPPVPNPANSPQTAAARASGTNPSPASRAGARRGARRDDPSRPRATTPPARRFAAPNSHSGDQTVVSGSRFDPQNAPARVSRVAVPSLLAAATHEADAVAYAVDAPSMPAVEVDALGSRSRMARYARHSGPRTPSMDVEPSVDAAIDEPHAVADEMPLTRQAGRPIAARPLLSAWQNPTVWRSVPSGVRGMRLVPVTVADLGAIETPTAATLVRPGELARMPLAAPVFVDRRPDAVEVPPARRPATTSSTSVASASEASTPRAGATPASSSAIPSAAVTSATTATTTATGTSGSVQRATRPASSAVATTWHALPAFGSSAAGAAATASPTARPSATHVSRQATIRRLGARHVDARRPGRSYAASALGYHATPLGPLGPVQWAVRADQPVLTRSTGTASVARAEVRPPVLGGLTLVRGGGEVAEPVGAGVPRSTSAASHLRLVSGADVAVQRAPFTADVRRVPTSSQPFVARPGAVAVHGIPAAAWSLLGLAGRDVPQPRRSGDENVPHAARFGPQNVSGAAVAARPGALARLSHGQPVRRRPLPEPMAGGIFVRRDAVAFGSGDQTVPVSGRFSPQNAPGDLGRSTSGQPVRRQPLPEPRTAGVVVVRTPSADAPLVPSRRTLGLPATPAGLARVASTATAAATATRPTVLGPEWRAQPAIRDPERSASVVLGPDGRVMRAIRDPERARERTYVASARSLPVAPAAMVVTTREASNAQPREVLPVARRAMSPSSTQAPARFREVLRAATGTTPAHSVALPARFRPLADRIVGRRPVRIAHGHASRQALAAVGAQAATTRSTIHLPAKPDGSARTAALVAHELAHVAASSSAQPRFHGGRRTREEDEAIALEHVVGRIARSGGSGRGPANVGTKDLPVAGFVGVRGATSGPPVPASATASASASASGGSPATQTTTFTRASNGSVIQRTPDASGASGGGGDSDVIRRTPSSSSSTRGGRGSSRDVIRRDFLDVSTLDESPSAIAGLSDAAIDALVASLEDRLIEALERRGGLWRGGF